MQENVLQHEAAPAQEDFKQKAVEKLNAELVKAKDKSFADPVIGHLVERCKDDNGLAQDVIQDHKTCDKCLAYIYDQARKRRSGNCAAVKDEVVYEWAEDYYHKDDKKEEAEKAERQKKQEEIRKKAEKQRKEREAKKAANANQKAAKTNKKAEKTDQKQAVTEPKGKPEPQKPKKDSKEMEGQMDLFSMMGL